MKFTEFIQTESINTKYKFNAVVSKSLLIDRLESRESQNATKLLDIIQNNPHKLKISGDFSVEDTIINKLVRSKINFNDLTIFVHGVDYDYLKKELAIKYVWYYIGNDKDVYDDINRKNTEIIYTPKDKIDGLKLGLYHVIYIKEPELELLLNHKEICKEYKIVLNGINDIFHKIKLNLCIKI